MGFGQAAILSPRQNFLGGYKMSLPPPGQEKLTLYSSNELCREKIMQDQRQRILPGFPHHITHRGFGKRKTFFNQGDYREYLSELLLVCKNNSIEMLAFCLMPNHVHLVLVPENEEKLCWAIRQLGGRYQGYLNGRTGFTEPLWEEVFHVEALTEEHYEKCIHYVHLNPVKAGLVSQPEDYQWSSAWCKN